VRGELPRTCRGSGQLIGAKAH